MIRNGHGLGGRFSFHNSDGDGGRVNPPLALCWRDALNSLPSSFVDEAWYWFIQRNDRGTLFEVYAVQSIAGSEHPCVGFGKIGDEEFGVGAAFASANFDSHWHDEISRYACAIGR